MNQSKREANTCSRSQARENASEQVTIGFGFTSDWLRKWCNAKVAMQNHSNYKITFDT